MALKLKQNQPDVRPEHLLLISSPLRALISHIEQYFTVRFNEPLIITSIIRKDSPIHAAGRAIDVRIPNVPSWRLQNMIDYFNWRFPYDPKRPHLPTILRHNTGRGDHLHIQVWVKPVWYYGGPE